MSRPSAFSLRGRVALAAIHDPRDLSAVRRQFERLGIEIEIWQPGVPCHRRPDVALLDDDYLPLAASAQLNLPTGCPVIALLGTETPSRLKLVLELDPASFLVKPLRSAGLYAALILAFERAARSAELAEQMARLEDRLRSRRIVLAAILQVMQERTIEEPAAFAIIRRAAMEQRKTIEQVCAEMITGRTARAAHSV
jgi:AmiR/NasT family two-component response regulator